MIFKFDIKKALLDILCGLLKKLTNGGNSNSNGGVTITTNTVNIYIGNGNNISNFQFIATDELSKIKTFDTTINKSFKITTDDISLWLYCNNNKNNECFALGKYLISSKYDSDKMALWIGLHTGSHTEPDPLDESLFKKNLTLIIEFLGKGWKNINMSSEVIKEKGDEHYYAIIEKFEEKSSEELLTLINIKLEKVLKDIKQ